MEFAEFIKTATVDNVILKRPFEKPFECSICITGHHLIISSRKDSSQEHWILHRSVDSLEKKVSGLKGTVTLKCKNFCVLQLVIPGLEEFQNVAASIEALSCVEDVRHAYPFVYQPMGYAIKENGWTAFHVESEFARFQQKLTKCRVSTVNAEFALCESYPERIMVHSGALDENLRESAAFRQGGRFPVMSFAHPNGAYLLRAGQPLVGPNSKRCRADEAVVNAALSAGKKGYIIDTRSINVSQMAKNRGGGFEPDVNYSMWKRVNSPIERHYNLRESLSKLMEVCVQSSVSVDKWLSKLASSNWLTHVKDLMTCSCLVAQSIDQEGRSVLVHGSEGCDSTLQVCSLAQVLLDKDCRTFGGFQALIEREWVQAGHPFQKRCVKSAFSTSAYQTESPVFLLFLDAVYQVQRQFPATFEFNESFLLTVLEHAYASSFGSFLCNNEKERKELNVKESTVSLWSFINRSFEAVAEFRNPLYNPKGPMAIWPSVAPQSIELWRALYLRNIRDPRPLQKEWEKLNSIKKYEAELANKVSSLRKHLMDLQNEAMVAGLINMSDEDINESHEDNYYHG